MNEAIRRDAVKRMHKHSERRRETFKRWQASRYRRDMTPMDEPLPP
ncbi:hypothetical protein [Aeromonas salmonicida]